MGLFDKLKKALSTKKDVVKYEEGLEKTRKEYNKNKK